MKMFKILRTKAAIAATVLGTGIGAFLMPAMPVMASDGNGAVYVELPEGWQNQARTFRSTEAANIQNANGRALCRLMRSCLL